MVYDPPLDIEFLFDDTLGAASVRRFVDSCLELGCRTQRDGGTECGLYLGPATDYGLVEMPLDEAVDQLAESAAGGLTLWKDDLDFTVGVGAELAPSVPAIHLSIDPVHFRGGRSTEETLGADLDTLLDLVVRLYLHSDALHVCGRSEPMDDDHHLDSTVDDLRAGRVDAVFWFNVFAPPAVERLSREKLRAAEWQTRELDDGSVLLVLSDNPTLFGYLDERDRLEERLGLRS